MTIATPTTHLANGEQMPALSVPRVGGGTISLPEDIAGSFGVVLIYRGAWCPFCNAQLSGFARAAQTFTELGIKVVALPLTTRRRRRRWSTSGT